ncbi:MAG: hypothetical protein AVDCRST_MAG59-854, partial [uncultured Thermomicrobiales bacterium]
WPGSATCSSTITWASISTPFGRSPRRGCRSSDERSSRCWPRTRTWPR